MKKPGKIISTIMLLVLFFLGLITLYFINDKFAGYMQLCTFIVPPLLFIMSGIVVNGIVERWKGK